MTNKIKYFLTMVIILVLMFFASSVDSAPRETITIEQLARCSAVYHNMKTADDEAVDSNKFAEREQLLDLYVGSVIQDKTKLNMYVNDKNMFITQYEQNFPYVFYNYIVCDTITIDLILGSKNFRLMLP